MNVLSLDTIKRRARHRLPGYRDAILEIASKIGPDQYALTDEQWDLIAAKYKRAGGPGTRLQNLIHAVVDRAPVPASIKQRIKRCRRCGRNARFLDRVASKINPFANS